MSSTLLLLLVILALPIVGALLALLLGRLLPQRFATVIAALALFVCGVVILVAVQVLPADVELGQALTVEVTDTLPQQLPTPRWVQPPRTLKLPTEAATPTPSPTPVQPTPTVDPRTLVTVVVRNGTGEVGLAGRVTDLLREKGFLLHEPEDDPEAGDRPYTLILDRGDHPEVRHALALLLKVETEHIFVNSSESSAADVIVIIGDDYQE